MRALLPVQVFLVMSPGGTIRPEVFVIGGSDKDIVQLHGATGLKANGEFIDTRRVGAPAVALAANLGLSLKVQQGRVDDSGTLASKSHVLATGAMTGLTLHPCFGPGLGLCVKAGGMAASTITSIGSLLPVIGVVRHPLAGGHVPLGGQHVQLTFNLGQVALAELAADYVDHLIPSKSEIRIGRVKVTYDGLLGGRSQYQRVPGLLEGLGLGWMALSALVRADVTRPLSLSPRIG
jgi:hypothetical protein